MRAADLRDGEAIYLDRLAGIAPLELTAQTTTAVYANRGLSAHVGNIVAGDRVRVLAYHPEVMLVRSLRGRPEGWVPAHTLSPVDPARLDPILAAAEEERQFAEAIEKKEVLAGMRFDHVSRALGRPDRRSFREDETGRLDVWSYLEYETRVEQQPYFDPYVGRTVFRYIRVKVPIGSTDIEFRDGRVTAVQRVDGIIAYPGVYPR